MDRVPRDAMAEVNREAWRRILRCVKDMIAVANRYDMRVEFLIELTDRRTGVSNHGEGA